MAPTSMLRRAAHAAIEAVDADAAVARWCASHPSWRSWPSVSLIAVGKAAPAMTRSAVRAMGDKLTSCLVVSDHAENVPSGCELIVSGHPSPNGASVAAGERALAVAAATPRSGVVLFLLSGGGSALLEVPAGGLDIELIATTTEVLLRSGAPIADINTVRTHLSLVKGGRLAAVAVAQTVTLAISDVVGSAPHAIASGPTVPAPTAPSDALSVLERWSVGDDVPVAVLRHLEGESPQGEFPPGAFYVIADGSRAAQAASQELETMGESAAVYSTVLEGEARFAAVDAYEMVQPGVVGVFAGETTVTVTGTGKGGRNQEAALTLVSRLAGSDDVALCLGTDGIDGPTDAAGAVVDGASLEALRIAGIDPQTVLDSNDAYRALDAIDALIRTGPTGTNVGDLWLISRA